MSILRSQLHITHEQGFVALPEEVRSHGYKPARLEHGIKVTITNNSKQHIKWLSVDVGLFHDSKNKSIVYDYEGKRNGHNYTTTRGMEIQRMEFWPLEQNGTGWCFVATTDSRHKDSGATAWTALRVYGETANGQVFVHHLAHGQIAPVTVTNRTSNCFVATAAYEDPDHPIVKELRQVRDELLTPCSAGRRFIAFYYRHGPKLAAVVAPRRSLRFASRAVLTPLALAIRATRSLAKACKNKSPQ